MAIKKGISIYICTYIALYVYEYEYTYITNVPFIFTCMNIPGRVFKVVQDALNSTLTCVDFYHSSNFSFLRPSSIHMIVWNIYHVSINVHAYIQGWGGVSYPV